MTTETQNYDLPKYYTTKRILRGLAIAFGAYLMLNLICLLSFQIASQISYFEKRKANTNDTFDTAIAFAYALAYNQLDEAKSYVAPNKWAFIESWPTRHLTISHQCKDDADPDLGPSATGGSESMTLFLVQDCPDYFYMLTVAEIVFKRVDNKWQVSDWSEICEKTKEERCY